MRERIPAEAAERVRLVVLDVDGVLTDGGVYLGTLDDGRTGEFKRFDIADGLGIRLLQAAGIPVALVSGRESEATRVRADQLGIACRQAAQGYKLGAVDAVRDEYGARWNEVALVADDLADLPALARVGLPVAVANAAPEVRAAALWCTTRSGGHGAVREFSDALLEARGERRERVEQYRREREGER